MHQEFIQQAIQMAADNVRRDGGPFAALIVRDGIVIAAGVNQVTRTHDPTAHAEIVAIREACRVLGDFQLTGCDVYSSCEPCPMCLGALYWARPARIFFAATRQDAADAGFDDQFVYRELSQRPEDRRIPTVHLEEKAAIRPFDEWRKKGDKTAY